MKSWFQRKSQLPLLAGKVLNTNQNTGLKKKLTVGYCKK